MRYVLGILLLLGTRISVSAFETQFADSMLEEAKKLSASEGLNFMLDQFYPVFIRNYDDGIQWNQLTLSYAVIQSNKRITGRAHLNLGMSYYMRGNYPACLLNYQKALSIFESIGDSKYIGRTCNEFSVYWRKQKQFETGLEYLDRSFKECTACKDTGCVETSLNNRAVIYEMMGDYQKAIHFYRMAEEVALSHANETGLAYIYADGAECYRLKGDLDSALIQIERSIAILDKLKNQQGIALNLINKASILIEKGETNRGTQTFLACIELARKLKYTDLLKNAHYQLALAYEASGKFEESFKHLDTSYSLRDSLLNDEKIKALSEMEVKYETEKISNNLLIEQQLRTTADLKLANRNTWLVITISLAGILLLLSLVIYQGKLRKTQAEKSAAIIQERELSLIAVLEATEQERQRIARELHDGIGQQMSGLKLGLENFSGKISVTEQQQDTLEKLTEVLDQAAAEIRTISHQMMPKVLQTFGLVAAIRQAVETSFQSGQIKCTFEHFNVEDRFDPKLELALFRICQELLSNVIRHSGASACQVQLYRMNSSVLLTVEDNGLGFDHERTSGGLGLTNIKTRLQPFNGTLKIESGSQQGSLFTVRVDLSSLTKI